MEEEINFSVYPMQDMEDSLNWYKSLPINIKIYLKEITIIICGIKWEQFLKIFTPRERIAIIYKKLKIEGIIK